MTAMLRRARTCSRTSSLEQGPKVFSSLAYLSIGAALRDRVSTVNQSDDDPVDNVPKVWSYTEGVKVHDGLVVASKLGDVTGKSSTNAL